jgi:predicted ribosome quality control (RQC) complex YloA/Tae2 family protein
LLKREFTSFDVAAVVHELKEAVLDSGVSNVYQLSSKTLLLKLHKPDIPAFRLVMEAGRRLHLTAYATEKPEFPPSFCMALRKHLRNGWLLNIEQYEFERVLIFFFKTKTGKVRLVLELFGNGNIILVGEKGDILYALTYKRMRDRDILRGEPFVFPPPSGKDPFSVSREEMAKAMRDFGELDVVRAIARFFSIGGVYAEEVLSRAETDKKKPCNALSDSEVDAIHTSLQALLLQVSSGKLEPCIVLDSHGEFVDVAPLKLRRYEREGIRLQAYKSFNEALDEFYATTDALEKATASVEVDMLRREAERFRRIVETQEKTLADAESKAEQCRLIGDLIYAHSGEFQALLDKFLLGKQSRKQWNAIVSEVLTEKKSGLRPSVSFESLDSENLIVNVCLDGFRFGLDLRKGLFENAAGAYERGKRVKQKLEGAKVALEDSRKKLGEIEAKIREAEVLEGVKQTKVAEELAERKMKRKEWFEKFRWFVSSDGFLVVGGKDAVTNEVLIKRHTEPSDIVFHADVAGAPFVVIKTGGRQPSEQVLREAGEFAAAFSRGWREGFGSLDVYWVTPTQLGKGGPSGEYVPHGAFVVSGKRNWQRSVLLRLAIGVLIDENGEIRFVGGPVDAVRAKTSTYAIVKTGDLAGKELFRRVLRVLAGKVPKAHREKALKASVDEIREYVPYGKGTVLEGF